MADRYLSFDRDEWAELRAATPLTLRQEDLDSLQGINERIDLDEVVAVYLPLSRLLNLYVSATQGSLASPFIAMRTSGDAASMIDLVRAEARAIDRDLPIYTIMPMEAVKADSVAQRRFVLVLVGLFGALALTLAAIGVYGVMSLLVSERTQEVGVRLALGAHPSDVLRMLIAQAVRLTLIGVAIGIAAGVAIGWALAQQSGR